MLAIYPTVESRNALTVFQIYEGTGEWFDLSKKPIERFSFQIGSYEETIHGYFVNEQCINCKLCYSKCPQKCIDYSTTPVQIIQKNCLHCGNCYEVCPVRAIEKR
ncbi:4Fe-4S binding protein [Allocoprobacillus halotolerans]|uniref:4Fe-4S binding protein n=1 Tax=Allocoprobacillus halotolerans TaxID=2944914 RepID=A0ABY5I4G1_9FIRM|nr:4Fe-4S binding protein [Allocoprobacillus halotolerans]UTY39076.1 4Fe-4S binding protein [Allocoprobacillus halotolerans]